MLRLSDSDNCLGGQGGITRLLPIAFFGALSSLPAGCRICFDHPARPLEGIAGQEIRTKVSRLYDRDMNAERLKFSGERFRKTFDRELARAIQSISGKAGESSDRRDVYDMAARLSA
jgi:hypothetical protein